MKISLGIEDPLFTTSFFYVIGRMFTPGAKVHP
jgi:hypothetical protein